MFFIGVTFSKPSHRLLVSATTARPYFFGGIRILQRFSNRKVEHHDGFKWINNKYILSFSKPSFWASMSVFGNVPPKKHPTTPNCQKHKSLASCQVCQSITGVIQSCLYTPRARMQGRVSRLMLISI